MPPIYFVPSAAVSSGCVAVKINALLGPATPAIPPRLAAGASSLQARPPRDARGLPGRPDGRDPSVFVGRRRRDVEAGSPAWVGEAVVPALDWAVEAAPQRLIGLSDAEYMIAKLDGGFPDLVRAALAQFSFPGLTTVLRGLVRERFCIRDLRTILEALLEYEWVGAETGDRLVFDERVVLPEEITPDVADDPAFRVEAVRRALAPRLQRAASDGEHAVVGVRRSLEASFERAALRPPVCSTLPPLSDAERERLLNDAWTITRGRPLVVVTSAGARTTIRELLATELPSITVTARGEMRPDQPTRRLALSDASRPESAS